MATQPVGRPCTIIDAVRPAPRLRRRTAAGDRRSSRTSWSRRTAASAASSAASSSRSRTTRSSASSRGRSFRSTTACSAPRASNAICKARIPTACSRAYCNAIPSPPAGFRPMAYDEAIGRVAAEIERIQTSHGPDAFAVLERRQPDHRESLPDGQVRPRVPEDRQHRLQRPAVHGQRRGRQQEGVRHRPRRQSLERHSQGRGHLDQRRQRRRVRPDHDQLRLAGPRERGARSSSSIRASRPWPAPATCSCRSSRAATSPCSTASCT